MNQTSTQQSPSEQSCRLCALSALCIPAALDDALITELESFISSGKRYAKNNTVYRQKENFCSLYVVKAGAVKTYITDVNGREHITGFYLPGEIIGLESIAGREYLETAVTLADCHLCKIDYAQLAQLRKNNSSLSDWAINLFSQSLASGHDFFTCLSQHTAVARLATFLLIISKRTSRTGDYQLDFSLPMSRQDIGNYLGLASETSSRAFSKLVEQQCIEKKNRRIRITDFDKLVAVSSMSLST
jgi:CRP/FNR family transcriptional regulator